MLELSTANNSNDTVSGVACSGSAPSADVPDVSFVVGAFNVAPYIAEAVGSALAQTGVTVEVVVVDDASTDGTPEIVAAIAAADSRVKLFRNTRNFGHGYTRNVALDRAAGRWIAYFDGDDVILPHRSRRLIDIAQAAGVAMVADNYERVDEDGASLGSTMIPRSASPYAFSLDASQFVDGNVAFGRRKRRFGAIKPLIETDFVRRHGIRFLDDRELRNEDFHFVLDAMLAGSGLIVSSESMYLYRQRRTSISHRLTSANCEAMLSASRRPALANNVVHDAKLLASMRRSETALLRAAAFVSIVERAKSGAWPAAIAELAVRTSAWPLVASLGTEMIAKRARRLAAAALGPGGH